jgi:hypothetical protein
MKRAFAHDDDRAIVERGQGDAGGQRWDLHRGRSGGKGGVTHKTKSTGRILGNALWAIQIAVCLQGTVVRFKQRKTIGF